MREKRPKVMMMKMPELPKEEALSTRSKMLSAVSARSHASRALDRLAVLIREEEETR